ncbi:phosphatidate cytidylyltransferase [Desulforamulus reducens MI-1]|uniref:Phosphatidate cytidylyltransferase n=1 Tax=Desulforamulus reducens (strain ATCC BAA-1160 / DSM 100696 / MI-1) TaxID=349161 RepID=A4J5Y7_DESRM|nr:phosphatidate cytidylyltransferase [Desulforamulus reducens MI-1]
MLHLRVLSAVIGIPVIVLAAWFGDWVLWLLALSVFTMAGFEISDILKGLKLNPSKWMIQIGGLFIFTSAYLYKDEYLGLMYVFLVIVSLIMMAFLYPRVYPVDVFGNLVAVLYLGNLIFFYLTRELENGFMWLLLLLAATWISDTFAYFVGRSLGRHKLAPVLSPKKTVEGAIGGVLGSALTAYIFGIYQQGGSVGIVVVLGVLIGIAALLGDLVESALKRQAGIKDSGQIIPGHGGFMDRFDSLLFTAPLVYYVVSLFII